MADAAPANKSKPFVHDGRPVFVLIPQNQGYSKVCQAFLEEQFSKLESPPEVCTEIKVRQLPPDSILYVSHPIKERKKDNRQKYRTTTGVYVSQPIDVYKVASDSNKKGFRTLNHNLLCQTVTQTCNNDPAGMFFRGTLTSEAKENPDALLLKISEQ